MTIELLAQRIERAADPDRFCAAVATCLERNGGNLEGAIELAETVQMDELFGAAQFDEEFERYHPRQGDGRFRDKSSRLKAKHAKERRLLERERRRPKRKPRDTGPKSGNRQAVEEAMADPELREQLLGIASKIGKDIRSVLDPEEVVQSGMVRALKEVDSVNLTNVHGWLRKKTKEALGDAIDGARAFKRGRGHEHMSLDEELDHAERIGQEDGYDPVIVLGQAMRKLAETDPKGANLLSAYYGPKRGPRNRHTPAQRQAAQRARNKLSPIMDEMRGKAKRAAEKAESPRYTTEDTPGRPSAEHKFAPGPKNKPAESRLPDRNSHREPLLKRWPKSAEHIAVADLADHLNLSPEQTKAIHNIVRKGPAQFDLEAGYGGVHAELHRLWHEMQEEEDQTRAEFLRDRFEQILASLAGKKHDWDNYGSPGFEPPQDANPSGRRWDQPWRPTPGRENPATQPSPRKPPQFDYDPRKVRQAIGQAEERTPGSSSLRALKPIDVSRLPRKKRKEVESWLHNPAWTDPEVIRDLIDAAPEFLPKLVYRGTNRTSEPFDNFAAAHAAGEPVVLKRHRSFSGRPEVADAFFSPKQYGVAKLHVITTSGAYIGDQPRLNQDEMVLPAGTKLHVLHVDPETRHVIAMAQHPDDESEPPVFRSYRQKVPRQEAMTTKPAHVMVGGNRPFSEEQFYHDPRSSASLGMPPPQMQRMVTVGGRKPSVAAYNKPPRISQLPGEEVLPPNTGVKLGKSVGVSPLPHAQRMAGEVARLRASYPRLSSLSDIDFKAERQFPDRRAGQYEPPVLQIPAFRWRPGQISSRVLRNSGGTPLPGLANRPYKNVPGHMRSDPEAWRAHDRHEYGHHLWFEGLDPTERREWHGLHDEHLPRISETTEYGATHPDESFAELFSLYTHPEYGQAEHLPPLPPAIEDYFRRVLGQGE